jgi:hypothetical protein
MLKTKAAFMFFCSLIACRAALAETSERKTQIWEHSGYPFESVENGYVKKNLCDQYFTAAQIKTWKRIFISRDMPAIVNNMLIETIAKHSEFTIVNDALQADILIAFDLGENSEIWRERNYVYAGTSDQNVTDDQGLPATKSVDHYEEVITDHDVTIDISRIAISGLTHPEKDNVGIRCGLHVFDVAKPRGRFGENKPALTKQIAKKVSKFLRNPSGYWMKDIDMETRKFYREWGF